LTVLPDWEVLPIAADPAHCYGYITPHSQGDMMPFVGMNLEQSRIVARGLSNQGNELLAVRMRIDSLVYQLEHCWSGHDSQSFNNNWTCTHRPRTTAASSALTNMSKELSRQITQQQEASTANVMFDALPLSITNSGDSQDGAEAAPSPQEAFENQITRTNVQPGIESNDPFDPIQQRQGFIGDCWLISTLNALMSSPEGDAILRQNVRWDANDQCYYVTLYEGSRKIEVPVRQTIDRGATLSNGTAGIISLYEAAIYDEYGMDTLWGNSPEKAIEMITGKPADSDGDNLFTGTLNDLDRVGVSGPATPVLGLTEDNLGPDKVHTVCASRSTTTAPSRNDAVNIVADHVYEVVYSADDIVGLRNPHGLNNGYDSGGIFYISREDFEDTFTQISYVE
jgi:uncharacterized protein YukE